jgi:nicotinamide-nucleotide amidase
MNELGVKEKTLSKYTAVSRQVAEEMVLGLREKTGSEVCVSVTGLAGPGGGTKEKPVGLVYIGCTYEDRLEVVELHVSDLGRAWIRRYSVLAMFNTIKKMLEHEKLPPM